MVYVWLMFGVYVTLTVGLGAGEQGRRHAGEQARRGWSRRGCAIWAAAEWESRDAGAAAEGWVQGSKGAGAQGSRGWSRRGCAIWAAAEWESRDAGAAAEREKEKIKC
ncbi:hypothetical protein ACOSQ3_016726 [Xanthoceras sorbifolium]